MSLPCSALRSSWTNQAHLKSDRWRNSLVREGDEHGDATDSRQRSSVYNRIGLNQPASVEGNISRTRRGRAIVARDDFTSGFVNDAGITAAGCRGFGDLSGCVGEVDVIKIVKSADCSVGG